MSCKMAVFLKKVARMNMVCQEHMFVYIHVYVYIYMYKEYKSVAPIVDIAVTAAQYP